MIVRIMQPPPHAEVAAEETDPVETDPMVEQDEPDSADEGLALSA